MATIAGFGIAIRPRRFGGPLNWETRASILASALFAYSALFWGIGTWMVTSATAKKDRRVQQQALIDAVAIEIRRGADACAGHMDISGPDHSRAIGLVPQLQLESLLKSDIPLTHEARYFAALLIEGATFINNLLSPLNPRPETSTQSIHSMCKALAVNRTEFEKQMFKSLANEKGLQYRSALP